MERREGRWGCCHTMHCHAASLAHARTALRTHGAAHALRTHGSACGSLAIDEDLPTCSLSSTRYFNF